jgi:hypothetical protein
MNMEDETGFGLANYWIQQDLISAYEHKCPLRLVRRGRYSLKWTADLEPLRRGERRFFNNSRRDKNPQSWELYREGQRS